MFIHHNLYLIIVYLAELLFHMNHSFTFAVALYIILLLSYEKHTWVGLICFDVDIYSTNITN